ncbi:undecaprenyl-phosphate glucose phosphotransferase [bacterium AH-315-P15]|nr:undecaprenyl-phosphate glucose phosphotransferase [bacterium AH-315-P15]
MAGLDVLSICGAGLFTYLIYPVFVHHTENVLPLYLGLMAVAAIVALPIFQAMRLYAFDAVLSPRLRDVWQMFLSWSVVAGAVIAVAFMFKATDDLSRGWIILWYLLGGGGLALGRAFGATLFTVAAKRGVFDRPTLVYGSADLIPELLDALTESASHMEIMALFEDQAVEGDSNPAAYDELVTWARRNRVENIILALPAGLIDKRRELLRQLRTLPVNIYLGPDELSLNLVEPRRVNLGNLIFAELARKPLQDWDYVVKAVEDHVIAALVLLFASPLFLAIAIAIKLDSPGPVLFQQPRTGFNNDLIRVYKFRTMRVDQTDSTGQMQTVPNDPRVTRVGRFLRTWSLDELPQFINVLQGRMSIVGPRAHVPTMLAGEELYYEVVDEYASRHRVKPGISGLAQINGYRGVTDTIDKAKKRVEYDLFYIDNWSLLLDLKIILLTPFAVIKQLNAY